MYFLRHILNMVGYKEKKEQLSFIKLLAYRNCFDNPLSFQKVNNPTYQIQSDRANEINMIWQKLNLKEKHQEHSERIITHSEAEHFLNLAIPSLQDGYNWLRFITEMKFLRPTFQNEGTGAEKEKIAINTSQWSVGDEISIAETEQLNASTISRQLYECVKDLRLIQSFTWPIHIAVSHVIFLSSLSRYIDERINFLLNFQPNLEGVSIDFVSGIRGGFNCECIAPILADWFEEPWQEKNIQKVLDRHMDFKDPKNWTRDLAGLKTEILEAINKTKWCNAETKSWYYKAPETFDNQSRLHGKESLKDWPVAMDVFLYLFKKKLQNFSEQFNKIAFRQLLVEGNEGRLPTTENFISAWYKEYGHEINATDSLPIFVACNATHRLDLVMQNINVAPALQDEALLKAIKNKIIQFNNKSYSKPKDLYTAAKQFQVIGPKANEWSLSRCLDVLARKIGLLDKVISKLIEEYISIKEENEKNKTKKQTLFIKQIQLYHEHVEHMAMVNAVINLGLIFYFNQDYVKTSGLFNFAQQMLKKFNQMHNKVIIVLLSESTLIIIKDFILMSNKKNLNRFSDVSFDLLKVQDKDNKFFISKIREHLAIKFKLIKPEDKIALKNLYEQCYREMNDFFILLIRQSIRLYGWRDTQLCIADLGSNSRKQATPFSDREFLIFTGGDQKDYLYSKEITKLLLLKILNLGETILRSLGISVKDEYGKDWALNNPTYDNYSPRGFSFDFNDWQTACKTPLGMKKNSMLVYRLIGSPREMVELGSSAGMEKDFELPQLLRLTRPLAGDLKLFEQFRRYLFEDSHFDLMHYLFLNLKRDLSKYLSFLEELENLNTLVHKNYFYRPITLLLDDLYMFLNPTKNCSSYKKINMLCDAGIITHDTKNILDASLTFILFLRMKQHYLFSQNKYEISLDSEEGKKLKYYLSQLKSLFVFYQKNLDEGSNLKILLNQTFYENKSFHKSVVENYKRFSIFSNPIGYLNDCQYNHDRHLGLVPINNNIYKF